MPSVVGDYQILPFPKRRLPIIDILKQSKKRHHVMGLFEVDISKAREYLNIHKDRTGGTISLTAWVIICVGKAISEFDEFRGFRRRSKLIRFDDVDVQILIEREHKGKKIYAPYVVRKANEKTLLEVHNEIRSGQKEKIEGEHGHVLGRRGLTRKLSRMTVRMPWFVRMIVARRLRKDPFFIKRVAGTVGITSLRMFNKSTGWAIPISIFPVNIAIGGTGKKPVVVDDEIVIREMMSLTIQADHDVIDGGPAARFVMRLKELMDDGYGLSM